MSEPSNAPSGESVAESFGQARAEMDQILERIERDRALDVDDLADCVERASALIKFCYERLEKAEVRVRKVTEELGASVRPDED
ncbi:MAG: exodeoxyribonuclease VII small subunit [Planctomycetes bacterium]|nr:exodeoxyribonuclease VII small subunit [Planctomycetota bacterium]